MTDNDLAVLLRADPDRAVRAIKMAKIAGPWRTGSNGTGSVRDGWSSQTPSLPEPGLRRAADRAGQAWHDSALKNEGWALAGGCTMPAPEPAKPSTYRFCLACREDEGDCHCEFLGKTPAWEERDSKTGRRIGPAVTGEVKSGIGISIAPVHIAPNEFLLIPVFLLKFERGLVTVDPSAMLPGASVPSLNTEITFLPGPTDQWGVPQHVHGDSSQISEIPSGFVPVIEALKQQYGRILGMDAAIFCPTMDQRYRYAITMLSFPDRKWNIVVVRSPREETGVDDHAHWFLFRRPVDYWRAHERLVGLTMRKLQRSVPKDVTCNCPQGAGSGARK